MVKLALPVMGMSVFQLFYNFVDMVWVGKLGTDAVSAVGTVSFMLSMSLAVGAFVNNGAGVKTSHAVGAKDRKKAGSYVATGLLGMSFIGCLSAFVLLFFPEQLVGFFELEAPEVVRMAQGYLTVIAWGLPFSLTNILFTSAFNAHGLTRTSFRINATGTLLNLLLDPILIFGLDMGVEGAAMATVFAHILVFAGFLVRILRYRDLPIFIPGISFRKLGDILRIGGPIGVQRVIFMSVSVLLAKIIILWGTTGIAVQKIGLQLEAITYMALWGITSALQIMIGQQFGSKDFRKLRETYYAGIKLAFVISLVSSSLFVFFPEYLFRIFVDEPETLALGRNYLMILGVSQLFMSVEYTSAGAFNALGKSYMNASVSVVFTLARIPLALFLSQYLGWGLNGVWWSITFSSMVKGSLLSGLFLLELKKIEAKESGAANGSTLTA